MEHRVWLRSKYSWHRWVSLFETKYLPLTLSSPCPVTLPTTQLRHLAFPACIVDGLIINGVAFTSWFIEFLPGAKYYARQWEYKDE